MKIFEKKRFRNGRRHVLCLGVKIFSYKVKKKISHVQVEVSAKNTLPTPYFRRNDVCVAFSSDEKFAPYLGVAIKSLILNSSIQYNYDIVILDDGISEGTKRKITSLREGKKNVAIRTVDTHPINDKYNVNSFHIELKRFTRAAYLRLFIPEIFCHYKKVLYLDADIVILKDIAELYHTDLENKVFGAMPATARYFKNPEVVLPHYASHMKDYVESQYDYYNSAILLCNIAVMRKEDFVHRCMAAFKVLPKPRLVDQDILNIAFPASTIKQLDPSWVYTPQHRHLYNAPEDTYTDDFRRIRDEIAHHPKLIHYVTIFKPWKVSSRHLPENIHFWKYLIHTPFFDEVYDDFMRDLQNKMKRLEEFEKK